MTSVCITSPQAGKENPGQTLVHGCLRQADGGDDDVDELDADERHDDAADAIEPEVAPQDRGGTGRPVRDAAQGERDERDNDEGVEDDRREDRALRVPEAHDVEDAKL